MARTVSAARVRALLGSSLDRSPAYLALADGLRLLISDGRVSPGTRLPSERELTGELGLSRTTVTRAYAELRERGYLASRQGSGSVARLPVAHGGDRDQLLRPGDAPPGTIDLTCAASPAPPGVAAAYEAAVAGLPAYLAGTGYFPSGVPVLKEALAARYTARGLPTGPDQIVVTSGALAALAVVARAATRVGDRVLVENPTYPNALATLARSGGRLAGAPVDPGGWDLSAVTGTLRQVDPALVYLVPDFHNPTGLLMPDAQRTELAAALRRSRAMVVVDETLAEMALDDDAAAPLPLGAHLPDAVSVGSASKAFWGGLRIGWLRAPRDRVGDLVASRLSLDLGAPLLEQLVLTHLLAEREQVLSHHRAQLVGARDALATALGRRLPQWRFQPPAGGLALWCELPAPRSTALTVAAERHGVLLAAGPAFAAEGGLERFVRVPFTHSPDRMADAVDRLAGAWAEVLDREGAGRSRAAGRRGTPLVA